MGKLTAEFEITNERGLHARAAARFVETAGRFDADVTVTKDGQTVPGRSIMGLLLLVAGPGTRITVSAEGAEAAAALAALGTLVRDRFNEPK